MKYTLSITLHAQFDTASAAAAALGTEFPPGFAVEHAFLDLTRNGGAVGGAAAAPAPVEVPVEAPVAPKSVKPKSPKSDAAPAPAPAPASDAATAPAATPAVTAQMLRAFLLPFSTMDGGARRPEVSAFIKQYAARVDDIPANKLAEVFAAAQEQFK